MLEKSELASITRTEISAAFILFELLHKFKMSERARIQISTGVEISNVSTALDEGRDFKKSVNTMLFKNPD